MELLGQLSRFRNSDRSDQPGRGLPRWSTSTSRPAAGRTGTRLGIPASFRGHGSPGRALFLLHVELSRARERCHPTAHHAGEVLLMESSLPGGQRAARVADSSQQEVPAGPIAVGGVGHSGSRPIPALAVRGSRATTNATLRHQAPDGVGGDGLERALRCVPGASEMARSLRPGPRRRRDNLRGCILDDADSSSERVDRLVEPASLAGDDGWIAEGVG